MSNGNDVERNGTLIVMEFLAIVAAALCFGVFGLLIGQRIGQEKGERETLLAVAEQMRHAAQMSAQQIRAAEDAKLKAENAKQAGDDQIRKLERQIDSALEETRKELHDLQALAEAVVSSGSRNAMLKLQQALQAGEAKAAAARPPTPTASGTQTSGPATGQNG